MYYSYNPDYPDEQYFNPTHDAECDYQFINKHRCVHVGNGELDPVHNCPFLKAIKEDYRRLVYWFIDDGRCLKSCDAQGYTALHWAVRLGRLEIAQRLIEIGYDINANENYIGNVHWPEFRLGNTPLIFAAGRGADLEMFQFLLDYGAQPTWGNANGTTPLHVMAEHNHWQLAKLLLDKNPNCINLFTSSKATPLHYAATYGHEEIAYLLLDYGADLYFENSFSQTPLDVAKMFKSQRVMELIEERLPRTLPLVEQDIEPKDLRPIEIPA